MSDDTHGWELPRPKPIARETLERATATEEKLAAQEHHACLAWFDSEHEVVIVLLTDGRVFGARPERIPSLRQASRRDLKSIRASEDGVFLVAGDLDLRINVDGLVTRLIEGSPSTVRRVGARLAGKATSPVKAAAAARPGRLGAAHSQPSGCA